MFKTASVPSNNEHDVSSSKRPPQKFMTLVQSDEFECNDDGQRTETWKDARQMELNCWRLYHLYVDRYERLEEYGSLEVLSDVDSKSDSEEDKNTKKEDELKDAFFSPLTQPSSSMVKESSPYSHFHESRAISILAKRILLRRQKHLDYLFRHLSSLSSKMIALDASKPWIVYWITQAIDLLGGWETATEQQRDLSQKVIPFMKLLEHPFGGYGGGPRQLPHLAATYAAVASIINVGTEEAFESIDRHAIYNFLKQMRDPVTKGFYVHQDGELDVRGAYCAVSVASLLQIVTDELFDGIENYISSTLTDNAIRFFSLSLQSFDGGLCGESGLESHGGYSYCGFASLAILGKHHSIDLQQLYLWIVSRQSDTCGGFNGRPNKLTDSCYSFWCAGILSLLSRLGIAPSSKMNYNAVENQDHLCLFDSTALQLYILTCCQEGENESIFSFKGGLRDKPEAQPDFYHTCYALSGLSLAQHIVTSASKNCNLSEFVKPYQCNHIVGPPTNLLQKTDPFYNINVQNVQKARQYFLNHPFVLNNSTVGTEGSGVLSTC